MRFKNYIEVLSREKRPFRFIASRAICRLGLWRFFRISCDHYTLKLHPAALAMRLWVDGQDRGGDLEVITRILRAGDVYVDVGANIGQLALAASVCVGAAGVVYAFEPHPRTHRFLTDNIRLNRATNAVAVNAAVGDRDGWCVVSDGRSDDQNRISENGFRVLQVRLDQLFPSEVVRLLKIDVEGFEEFVLRGGESLLGRVDVIFFESCDQYAKRYGSTANSVISFLVSKGFVVYQVQGTVIKPVEPAEHEAECRNLIACRDPTVLTSAFSQER